jgi:hypothetical protein
MVTTMDQMNHFDVGRATLEDHLNSSIYPPQLFATNFRPLQQAVNAAQVDLSTHLLTFEHQDQLYAFPMSLVVCYNVIQGQTDEQPWMMTFCNACNTGIVFDPVVNGQQLHFQRRGSYDGLLLIYDRETQSYWQHITGAALYGPSVSQQLRMLTTTRQITVAEALTSTATPIILTDSLSAEQTKLTRMMEAMRSRPERVQATIVQSLGQEDTRRPRFELGLGLWGTAQQRLFVPLTALFMRENVIATTFAGRDLLIYQHPDALSPVAVYLKSHRKQWEGDTLRLDSGASIRHDQYFTAEGKPQPLERPNQLLMRWYGFAATFRGCDVLDGLDPSA